MSVENNPNSTGPIIGSIIIVLLLLAGGYYSFQTSSKLSNTPVGIPDDAGQPVQVINIPAVPPQESTEISDIEEDVKTVPLDEIDVGLDNLDLLVSQ